MMRKFPSSFRPCSWASYAMANHRETIVTGAVCPFRRGRGGKEGEIMDSAEQRRMEHRSRDV